METSTRKGTADLLHASLALLVELSVSLTSPWAKPLVAGLKILLEATKLNPSWNPAIPPIPEKGDLNIPEKREKYLRDLERSLLEAPPPGVDCEKLSEVFGYRELWRLYPDLHDAWILPSESGPPLTPFIEHWTNLEPTSPALPVHFVLSENPIYQHPPVLAQTIGAISDNMVATKLQNDEPKVRICSASSDGDHLRLEFGFSRYSDYLRTNWAVANLQAPFSEELRKQLCGTGELWALNKSQCSNHLGVSAIIAFDGEIILPISSSNVISSPDMLVPSASGSADFLATYWIGQVPGPAQDILRETQEELCIDPKQFAEVTVRFLALTRNVLRGGKPEAFYYVYFPREIQKRTYFEHADRPFLRLPSLLDKDNSPVHDFERHMRDINNLILGRSNVELVISPFTRVALNYYISYAKKCRSSS
jgi:hypothetical protein